MHSLVFWRTLQTGGAACALASISLALIEPRIPYLTILPFVLVGGVCFSIGNFKKSDKHASDYWEVVIYVLLMLLVSASVRLTGVPRNVAFGVITLYAIIYGLVFLRSLVQLRARRVSSDAKRAGS